MNDIKLIIWDLDDTLWQGTLAEDESVVLDKQVINRIEFLLDKGIMHSICSKNEAKQANEMLKKFGIANLFIFPKISFENKGLQVKKIINQAQLRPQNVLFVDDNLFVLREVAFHNSDITVKLINDFLQVDVTNWGRQDPQRERLAHYKILEQKEDNKIAFIKNNHDEHAFLKTCHINITLMPLDIKDADIDRIIELVNRANQLNFTNSRIKYDYLFTLFELKNGCNFKVLVADDYGDYGVVGYVCVLDDTLLHFVFSCRILGMCVEAKVYQWLEKTYHHMKLPFKLDQLKDVATNLEFITLVLNQKIMTHKMVSHDQKILVRGPCLANAISGQLSHHYQVDEEIFSFFEYANLDFLRKNIGHKEKTWFDKTNHALKGNDYTMIINFLESDYYSGHYKIKKQVIPIASNYIFWQNLRLIKQDNQSLSAHIEAIIRDGLGNLKKFNIGHRFSPWPNLEKIANMTLTVFGVRWQNLLYQLLFYSIFKNYSGYVSAEQFEDNVRWYSALFPNTTTLVFINPPEKITLPLLNDEQQKKIINRTKTLNTIMRTIASEASNIRLLEMDDSLNQEDIIDSFSHLKRQGYLKLSQSLLNLVNV